MNIDDFTPEQQERARACRTPEELLALAAEEGYDLTDGQLEAVSGGYGGCGNQNQCGMPFDR